MPGKQIQVAQFGEILRFPSGNQTTCIIISEGFLDVGKQYYLFLWRRSRADDLYIVSEAYLMDDSRISPVILLGSESAYEGMPVKDFEAKLGAAVSKNANVM